MIRTFGGVVGLTNQPQGLDIGLSGSNMKSYQSGEINWNDTNLTKDIPISTVSAATNGTVAVVRIGVMPSNTGAPNAYIPGATLLNATTLRLTRNAGVAIAGIIYNWEVIEFYNVKSKQTGITALSANPTNITISSINAQKSIPIVSYNVTDAVTAFPAYWSIVYRLKDNTTLSISMANYNFVSAFWQVIEFN